MMVMQAQECEVFKVGRAARFPGDDMVGVGEGDVGAPGKRQCRSRRMTSRRWASEGVRRARPSYMVCPTSSSTPMAMVASQAICWTAPVLIRPSRSRSPASSSSRRHRQPGRREGRGRRRSRGWPSWPGPRPGCRGADELQEGVTQTLVPRGLAVGGDVASPGLEAGPGLGEGLRGQLHTHGAERFVEAEKATVVLGSGLKVAGGLKPSGRCRPALAPNAPSPGRAVGGLSRGWPRRPAP